MRKLNPTVKTIEDERKRQNISVQELAAKAGVHFSGLYRVLSGEAVPSIDTVDACAAALGLRLLVKK